MSQYMVCCRNGGNHCDVLMLLGDELVPANKNVVSSNHVDRATSLSVCNGVAPPFGTIRHLLRNVTCLFTHFYCRNIFALRLFRSIRETKVAAILLVTCLCRCLHLRLGSPVKQQKSWLFFQCLLNILVCIDCKKWDHKRVV